ncbi:MAG: PA2779 family protein, partial [Rhodoferax sp.]|nr:PA2779 family protein [Rhodoferax sp.]
RILILAMLSLSFQTVSAGMIGTDQAAVAAAVQSDRAVILGALSRSDVSSQLQAQGLDPAVARDRVAAMTDEEVRTLASGITAAPAGANSAWGAVILIGLLVWFVFYRK